MEALNTPWEGGDTSGQTDRSMWRWAHRAPASVVTNLQRAQWAIGRIAPPAGGVLARVFNFAKTCTSSATWTAVLGTVSDIAKVSNVRLGPHWRWYVNIPSALGYNGVPTHTEAVSAIHNWVGVDDWQPGDRVSAGEDQRDEFLRLFRVGVRQFLSHCKAPQTAHTLATFLADPALWATTGSSLVHSNITSDSWPSVEARDRGDRPDTSRMPNGKWPTAAMLSPQVIEEAMYDGQPGQQLTAVVKREAGKTRYVIASDDRCYWLMSYIAHVIEPGMRDHPHTPLFWSAAKKVSWQKARVYMLQSGTRWFTPVDQSKFDHHFTKAMVDILVSELCACALRNTPAEAMEDVHRATLRLTEVMRMAGSRVRVDIGGMLSYVPYKRGLLSGWRWTSLMNTAGNFAICYAVRMVQRLLPPQELLCMGDDTAAVWLTKADALKFTRGFVRLGFDVNPRKTFISQHVDEFLRMVYSPKGWVGYPWRTVAALLYRRPWLATAPPRADRMRDVMDSWMTLISRSDVGDEAQFVGGRTRPSPRLATLLANCVRDVAAQGGVSRDAAWSWMCLATALGGGGWTNASSGLSLATEAGVSKYKGGRDTTANVPWLPRVIATRDQTSWFAEVRSFWKTLPITSEDLMATVAPPAPAAVKFVAVSFGRHERPASRGTVTRPPLWQQDVPTFGQALASNTATADQLRELLRAHSVSPSYELAMLARFGVSLYKRWVTGDLHARVSAPTVDPSVVDLISGDLVAAALGRNRPRADDVLADALNAISRVERGLLDLGLYAGR